MTGLTTGLGRASETQGSLFQSDLRLVNRVNGQLAANELRGALGRFATGVAIVTTHASSGPVGLTINSFSSVSLDPPLVLWSLRKDSSSLAEFAQATHYAINVLAVEQEALAKQFASKIQNKFDGVRCEPGISGAPVLSGCLAQFECRLAQSIECGDHIILIGEVEQARFGDAQPLLFYAGSFLN